jgi:hypothetical protein
MAFGSSINRGNVILATTFTDDLYMKLDYDIITKDLLIIHLCNCFDGLYMFNIVSIMLSLNECLRHSIHKLHLPHHQRLTSMAQTMSHVITTLTDISRIRIFNPSDA